MITLVFSGEMSAPRRRVFEDAAAKWDRVLDTGFAPVEIDGDILRGVQIDAGIAPIDGDAGVLGQAGPSLLLDDTGLPAKGVMQFDTADVERLEAEGSFADVILHEMAHVLGFGTLWARAGLVAGSGTDDPRFTGVAAVREYALLDADGGAVPIANTGGAGTREGHWREGLFGDELLTGFLSGDHRPLSRMSIGAFADLGYEVDYDTADPYELPTRAELELLGLAAAEPLCELCRVGRPETRVIQRNGS